MFLGPIGYGIIFQFMYFLNIFTSTVHLGVPTGISAKIPSILDETPEIDESGLKLSDYYYFYFIKVFFLVSLFFTLLIILFADQIVNFLIGEVKEVDTFIMIIVSAPFIVLYTIGDSFLRCLGKLTQIVTIAIVSSLGSILILYPLLQYFGIFGVSIYLFVNALFVFLLYIYLNFDKFKLLFRRRKPQKLHFKSQIIKMGIVSLISSFLFIGSNIMLRKFTIDNFGLTNNGIYQSIASLSASSFLIVYNYLATYLLPKISGYKSNSEIRDELDINFRFILLLMVPSTIVVFSYRYVIISLLFSSEFIAAGEIIQYQFMGDFFRGLSGLFGIWMVYKMKLKFIIFFDLLMNLILVSLPYLCMLFLNEISLKIVPISYLIALLFHFVLYYVYSQSELKYFPTKDTMNTLVYSVILLSATFASVYLGSLFQYVSAPIFVLIFWSLAVSRIEREKFLKLLRSKISFVFTGPK